MALIKTKYKLIGGETLGKGVHGIVSDVCLDDGDSFCDLISETDTIYLYDDNLKKYKVDTVTFLDWLTTDYRHNTIAKRFTSKERFKAEVIENKKVLEIYKKHPEMITLDNPTYVSFGNGNGNGYGNGYGNGKVIKLAGISIQKQKETIYGLFGFKCSQEIHLNNSNVVQFIKNMLESIKVINDQNYYHNDIKLPNIVSCQGRFNLIDWGTSSKLSDDYRQYSVGGGPIFSSPVKLYFTSKKVLKFGMLRKSNIPYILLKKYLLEGKKKYLDYINPGVIKVDKVKRRKYEAIKQKLIEQHNSFLSVSKGLSDEELFDKYKKTFDVYMLGMTLLHAIYKFDLEYDEIFTHLMRLVDGFISLENPLDIDEALALFNETKRYLI